MPTSRSKAKVTVEEDIALELWKSEMTLGNQWQSQGRVSETGMSGQLWNYHIVKYLAPESGLEEKKCMDK